MSRLILASGSPRRRELLASLGLEFEVVRPDVDETQYPDEPPFDYVRRLSIIKAQTVARRLNSEAAFILAADTIVVDSENTIQGKPADADDARRMLRHLRGRDHTVCTAFTLLPAQDEAQKITQLTFTTVTMRDYVDAEIEAYIATGDPFDKAGGYAIQHEGFHPVAKIDGSYENVVGLPTDAVRAALAKFSTFNQLPPAPPTPHPYGMSPES